MGKKITVSTDPVFDEFWAAYPRHDGKLAAKRKWDRLHLAPDVVVKILTALEWQRLLPGWQEVEFIPHAATYLHNARWEDEPPRKLNGHSRVMAPAHEPWSCPHVEAHVSRWRCEQATALGKPVKA